MGGLSELYSQSSEERRKEILLLASQWLYRKDGQVCSLVERVHTFKGSDY